MTIIAGSASVNIFNGFGIHVLRKAALEQFDVAPNRTERLLQIVGGDVSELLDVMVGALEVLGGALQGFLGVGVLGNRSVTGAVGLTWKVA